MQQFLPLLRRPTNRPLTNYPASPQPPTGRRGLAQLKATLVLPVLSLLLTLTASLSSYAQLASNYTFTPSSGTFTPISGGTAVTAVQADVAVSAAIPLNGGTSGTFNFTFEGINYTSAVASSNGALFLGTTGNSADGNNISTSTVARPILAPFWDDLNGATAPAAASYKTDYVSGSSGPRVFTFEWLNWRHYNNTSGTAVLSFQVKLYEGSNRVEFVYRSDATALYASATASIGIGGLTSGNFLSLTNAGTAPGTSSTTETTSINAKPATGQIYAFTALPLAYTSSTVSQTGGYLTPGTTNQVAATLQVNIGSGSGLGSNSGAGPGPFTQVVANTNGTTSTADLTTARLYYSTTSTFSTSTATLFGSAVLNPSGTLTFTGSQAVSAGANYFFLVYNIASGATAGDVIDAEITSVTVGGTAQTPTVTAPPQSFTIVTPNPLNGPYTIDTAYPTDYFTGTFNTGTYGSSGIHNFHSFADAISALNTLGVNGAVTFYAIDGETFNESNLVINPVTGANANNTITFTRDQGGSVAPIIAAAPGTVANNSTGNLDAIFKLNGADYITFDGLTLTDPNTTNTSGQQMEYGILLLRTGTGAALDGSNNNIIQNCSISLQAANSTTTSGTSVGIASLPANIGATSTVLSASGVGTTGQSSNNKFYHNVIQNVNTGFYLLGLADASFTNYDQNNDIGGTVIYNASASYTGTGSSSGNLIQSFGGVVTGVPAYGIRVANQNGSGSVGFNIGYNIINNNNGGDLANPLNGTLPSITTLNGIVYEGGSRNVIVTINGNQINQAQGVVSGANSGVVTGIGINAAGVSTLNIGANFFTFAAASGASGAMTAIASTGDVNSTGVVNITNNQFTNSPNIATSGALTFINDQSNGANATTISGNIFKSVTKTVGSGTVTGIQVTSTNTVASSSAGYLRLLNNQVQLITLPTATGTAFTGISSASAYTAPAVTVTGNVVSSITGSTSTTASGSAMLGFTLTGGGPNSVISGNTATIITGNGNINGLNIGTGFQTGLNVADNVLGDFTSSYGNVVYGVNIGGGVGTHTYQRNKIFKLTNNGPTSGTGSVNGFYAVGTSATTPLTVNLFNNLVGNLNVPVSLATGTPLAGIYLGSNILAANVYHNTIYINNTHTPTTAATGTSTGLMVFGTASLDLRNNLVINTSTTNASNATGYTYGFQRSSTVTATNYLPTSNGNLFYVGTTAIGTKTFLFSDGSNKGTLANYKLYLAQLSLGDRDFITTSQPVSFSNNTGSTLLTDGFLHLAAGTSPAARGGVAAATLVPKDYDVAVNGTGDTRDTVTPFIGGDENAAISPADLVGPNISYTALGNAPAGTTSRTVTNVTITDGTGVQTAAGTRPRLYYKRSTDPNTIIAANDNSANGWKYVEASNTSSPFQFTIDYSKLSAAAPGAGVIIQYFVTAQDIVATPNVSLYAGPNAGPPTTAPTSVALVDANLPTTSSSAPVLTINSYTLTGSFTGDIFVGNSQTYTSLTGSLASGGLFAAINAGVVTGNVTVKITSNTTEDGTTALTALNTDPSGSAYTVTIQADPATAGTFVLGGTSTVTTGLVRLSGVRNITFNGGSSTSPRLVFRNISGASTPTFLFLNDAAYNTIQNCAIEGVNTSTASGTVVFGSGVANGIGNSYNTLSGNDIRQYNYPSGTTFPAVAVYSSGLSALVPNQQNVIQNNNLHNFTYSGLYLSSSVGLSSQQWTIGGTSAAQGNRIYEDASITLTAAIYPMYIATGNNHTITYNSLYQAAGVINTSSYYYGMYITAGGFNLTVSNNTIGGSQADGLGSPMQINNTGTFYTNYGLYLSVGTTVASMVQNNKIINFQSIGAGNNTTTYGLYFSSGLANISGNYIGNASATYGIKATATGNIYGLYISGPTNATTVTGNTIRNLGTLTGQASGVYLYGLYAGGGNYYTVDQNTVQELLNNGYSNGTKANQTLGLYIGNSNPGMVIRRNTISDIRNISTTASTVGTLTEGITAASGGAGALVTENTIYNISTDNPSTSTEIVRGIENSGSATFANNRVSLTGGASTTVFQTSGIYDLSTGTPNFYYNSVYLAGSGTSDSYAYYRTGASGSATLRNNILYNARTGIGAAYAIAVSSASAFTSSSSNTNFLVSPSATTVALFGTTPRTLDQFQQSTGGDQNSFSDTPAGTPAAALFVAPASNLKINPSYYNTQSVLESQATPVASVTTDFEADTRPGPTGSTRGGGNIPDIGADEFDGTLAPVQYYVSSTVSQITAGTFPGGTNQAVIRLSIVTANTLAPLNLTSVVANLNGSTSFANDLVNLGSVKLYYAGVTPAFDPTTATLYGTTDPATGSLVFLGSQRMAAGTNYFYLTYDLKSTATVGDVIDGEITQITLSGTNYVPSTTAPAGNRPILGPMAGNYYVGTALGTEDFATITDAFNSLQGRGVNAATSLILTNTATTYNSANGEIFPLVLNPVAGASATNFITIKPNTGATPLISGTVGAGAVLKLNGADYVTIDGSNNGTTSRNLTIENITGSTGGNAVLWLANNATTTTDGATNNAIKNTIVRGSSLAAPNFAIFVGGSSASTIAQNTLTANSNNSFDNLLVQRSYYGIFLQGVSNTVLDQSNSITNSAIGASGSNNGLGLEGIRGAYQQNLAVIGNEVQNVAANNTAYNIGIRLFDSKTASVRRNKIHDITYQGASTYGAYGIELGNSTAGYASAHIVSNNMVYGITAPAATGTTTNLGVAGISTGNGAGDQFYFNSVLLTGTLNSTVGNVATAFANGDGLYGTATTGIDVRNNIFVNTAASTVATQNFAHYTRATAYAAANTLNYNDLYVATTGSAVGNIGYFNSTSYSTLANWRTAVAASTGAEANSVSVDPKFTSTTDLHLTNQTTLDNSGVSVAPTVTVDIDNELRPGSAGYTGPGTAPDMGADELTVPLTDLGITAFVQPAAANCYSGTQPVQVTIRNFSATALTNTTVPVTVTITPPASGPTQTVTGYFTGSIPAGGTVNFVVGNYSAAVAGTYSFVGTTQYGNDPVAGNNALTQSVSVTAPATLSVATTPSSLTVCQNGLVSFTASASSGTPTYTWTSTTGGGLNSTSGATVTANPTQSGSITYTVTATDGACSTTQTVTITVLPLPTVTATASPSTVCAGGTSTLAVTSGGSYNVAQTTYAPYSIPATGFTTLTNASTYTNGSGDLGNFGVPLPFAFTYFGTTYAAASNLFLVTNGYVTFGTTSYTSDSPGSIPNTSIPAFIAGDGRDLNLASGGSITYFTTGTAPNRTFVIYYNGVSAYTTTNPSANFQLALHETTNVVDIISINLASFARIQGMNSPSGTTGVSSLPTTANTTTASTLVGVTYTYAPVTYSWSPSTFLSSTTGPSVTASNVTATTTYTVTATNTASGCQNSTTVTLTVNPRPTATLSNNGPINYNTAANISVALTGTGPWTFSYTKNGGAPQTVTATSSNPYVFSTGTLSSNTTYVLTALSDANCTATAADLTAAQYTTTVTVIPPATDFQPVALIAPAVSSSNCYGPSETVTVRVQNVGGQPINLATTPITVNISVGGAVAVLLSGTPTSTATIPVGGTFDVTMSTTLDMTNAGNYTFAISTTSSADPNTGNNTLNATRTKQAAPNVSLTATPNVVCQGTAVQLTANNAGEVPPLRITEVTLYSTGTGATSPYPAYVTTSDADFVEISNLSSSAVDAGGVIFQDWSSATATAANRTLTIPTGTIVPANGVIVINMGTGTDNAANRYFNTGGSAQYSSGGAAGFLIKTAAGTIIDAVGTNSFSFPAASGVTATDFSGSAPAASGNAGTVRTAANDTNTGADFTTSSTATQSIGTYNGGYTAIAPTSTFTYSYSASPNTGTFSNTSDHNPTFTASAAGTYTISVLTTDNACAYSTSTSTTTITVNPLPTATLTNGGPINYNNTTTVSIALTGNGPWTFTYTDGTTPTTVTNNSTNPYVFTTPVLANTTTYSLTALSDANCTASAAALAAATTTITVNAPPKDYAVVSLLTPNTTSTCYSTAETVTVRVRNNGTVDLDFSVDPLTVTVNVTGAITQTFTTVVNSGTLLQNATYDVVLPGTLNMTTAGTYSFAISATSPNDVNTGNDNLTATRTVNPSPTITTAAALQSTICLGASTTLVAQAEVSPSAATYGVVQTPYLPYSIPATGFTTLTNASTYTNGSGDLGNFGVPLPFAFTYFGTTYAAASNLFLVTNGYVTFGTTSYTSDSPGAIPNTSIPAFIAGDGRDLDLSKGGSITYFTTGTAPNRTFVIYYNGVSAYTTTNPSANFQLALHETTNVVDIISINLASFARIQGMNSPSGTTGYSSLPTTANTTTASTLVGVTYTYTPGANTITYTWMPGNLTGASVTVTPTAPTTYTVTASNGISCASTQTVTVTPTTTTTWTGVTSTDWYTASNWTYCVPTATIDAVVPGTGITNYPVITSGTATVRNLQIDAAGTSTLGAVDISGATTVLDIKGNLTSGGQYSINSGNAATVSFTSTAMQTIGSAKFGKLTVTGTAAKMLTGQVNVGGILDLTNGMLDTNGNTLLMLNQTSSFAGVGQSHYVITNGTTGKLSFTGIGTTGRTGAVVFPIGTTTDYTPATITNAGTIDVFSATVGDGISLQGTGLSTTTHVVNKTWDVTEATAGGSNVTLALQWNAADEIGGFNRNSAAIVHYENGAWNSQCFTCYYAASGSNPYSISRTGITTFSPFAVQDNTKPLPVELTRFVAQREGSNAVLNWNTASEKNNKGFDVQVSTDGRTFRSLQFVEPASANSSSPRNYTYTDVEKGKAGLRYYRLLQLDLDGTASLSPVRTVLFDGVSETSLTALPNPFEGEVTLTIQARTALNNAPLLITDASGRTVHEGKLTLPAGLSQLTLRELNSLSTGVYILQVSIDGKMQHVKLVKH